MKYNYTLVLIISVCIYISYANLQKLEGDVDERNFAATINEYINNAQNRGAVNDQSLANRGPNSLNSNREGQEQTKILNDNSKIQTMYDGAGNKTETRCFNDHPRLTCIVLSSGVNGQRQALVYGQNGDIKELPQNMLDNVTTASGDELANAAGIYAARRPRTESEYVQTTPVPTVSPNPTEKGQSLTQDLPAKQIETETNDNSDPASSRTKSALTEGNNQLRENKESSGSNRQLEERK